MATTTTEIGNTAANTPYISPLSPPEIFTANVLIPMRIATLPIDHGACVDSLEKSVMGVIALERSMSRGDISISSKLDIERLIMLAQIEFLATNPLSPIIISCSEYPQILYGYIESLYQIGLRVAAIS